mmetsp:Transcript_142385/g.354865  ORF Transcript_142385/g.354865 Transcript_142385/m.354865 type:complete len:88 (+) Transcript_142385:2849-3112(+)
MAARAGVAKKWCPDGPTPKAVHLQQRACIPLATSSPADHRAAVAAPAAAKDSGANPRRRTRDWEWFPNPDDAGTDPGALHAATQQAI